TASLGKQGEGPAPRRRGSGSVSFRRGAGPSPSLPKGSQARQGKLSSPTGERRSSWHSRRHFANRAICECDSPQGGREPHPPAGSMAPTDGERWSWFAPIREIAAVWVPCAAALSVGRTLRPASLPAGTSFRELLFHTPDLEVVFLVVVAGDEGVLV